MNKKINLLSSVLLRLILIKLVLYIKDYKRQCKLQNMMNPQKPDIQSGCNNHWSCE